ncbi:MAG: hypothetical protein Q8N89_16295 [Azonexus sp.]|nr:hypothetical protein [Azonexus sp.]
MRRDRRLASHPASAPLFVQLVISRLLTIVEIIKQADQGLSSPFLCRGNDGALYFVKGRASGRASLWAEWLAGHLGQAFGLPIPPFCIAEVPAALIRECPPELRPLGIGPAFASRKVKDVQWLELAGTPRINKALQRDAVFGDLAEQARYADRMTTALSVWDEACDKVPLEWWWENDEQDLPARFDPVAACTLAARCATPDFWRTL